MNILFLTQIIPYPPDAGPKVKTWHVLRYLSELGHNITLASFIRPEEQPYVDNLRKVCSQVYTIPIHRSRLADISYWARSNLSGRPFLIERDDLKAMRSIVNDLVVEKSIDVIHADQLTMTQFGLPTGGKSGRALNESENGSNPDRDWPVTVFDAHNAVWTIVERMAQNAPWFLRPVLDLETHRVKCYEASIVRTFDQTLAVTEPDRLALLKAIAETYRASFDGDGKIQVVPIAVDTVQLQPIIRKASLNIMTLGTLHYPPNADGIRWFLNEVFPLVHRKIPRATLTIVGKNPPKDFISAAEQNPHAITVTGYVPDLSPFFEAAALTVVPVRAGGGMRVRILEAFARAMPVVTTTIGLEGINAQPGRDVLVADQPEDFALKVIQLLQDADLQSRLAANGRQLAENKYDWQVVLNKLNRIYEHIAQQEQKTVKLNAHHQ